ncbi:MAG: AAA family ATPase, partial [Thermoplasmata archaeon]|nr:AAA family ATPase [Thermoplasmata archaeon]
MRLLSIALVSDGHVLLEGVPGLAKTSLVREFAHSLDLSFKR